MSKVRPLRWKEYCPKMPKVLTKDEIFMRQVNKEDEVNHPAKEWKPMKVTIPAYQKPYNCTGWWNFFKGLQP